MLPQLWTVQIQNHKESSVALLWYKVHILQWEG